MPVATHELTGTSSRYECRIKVEYDKDIMSLIEEGMLVAAEANILKREMISHMYNKRILDKIGYKAKTTTSDAYKDPRIGTIQMFESMEEKIPIYLDFESMVRYHFGIFAFTGAGKSNLLANTLRRILLHAPEI